MSDPDVQPVSYDVADGIATVRLRRPDAMNSLTLETKVALRDALHAAAADSAVRCVVLTGSGRAFCVGQDLQEHVAWLGGDEELGGATTVVDHYNPIVTAIATMPKPVIAAVNGIAAGAGSSMAFAADFRVLGRSAGFNTAFAAIAFSCDTGASWTLPRLIGHARATDLLMRPRTVGADEALSLGLATSVVDDEQLDAAVAELARELADGPTLAYGAIKRVLVHSASHDLASSLEQEGQKMAITGASSDHRVAVEAFLAKQKPVFTGR
ncbi:enoyl-CoA hydratase-related protein [Aeromicrobium wangtongii]|uniref:enoyl-CoA hydratase-related protein n=1 Tax=Aeromicrobium wangtongii TaxID=2969247 RepID=UPI0020179C2A|nr:enoyl-CoA hydratase-related protein [Aeromicrobium wangtongii]MCL3819919.1 enoyl-CoA hydratase-related protein [Aeromicrobium wangtongii]